MDQFCYGGSLDTLSIKNDYEFRRVYKRGKSYVNAALVIYILKNKKKINRVGITTSKKIGKAVERNRARRVIREAYRQIEDKLPQGYDFVFVARSRTCSIKMQNLLRVMSGIFSSAKLLAPNRNTIKTPAGKEQTGREEKQASRPQS